MLKRLFDIFLSSIGLIGSSPLWLLFFLAIKLEDRGSIFYAQEKVWKGGRIFRAMKFRRSIA
jgi:lipopolysaccharide/colanic/teichoic acid biosynthesis glycosyltransferase